MQLILIILICLPFSAIAEEEKPGVIDNKEGGFFEPELYEKGFFEDDRASFPVKNNVGNSTRLRGGDSWDIRGTDRVSRNALRNMIRDSLRSQNSLLGPPPPPAPPPLPARPRNNSGFSIR
jgi:hypothetical protein